MLKLTPRQRDIAHGFMLGLSDAEIQEHLHITHGCLSAHRHYLFAKMGVHNRTACAVQYRRLLDAEQAATANILSHASVPAHFTWLSEV